MRFLLLLGFFIVAFTAPVQAAKDFRIWLDELRAEAQGKGVSDSIIRTALHGNLQPIERIIELDRKQPEGTMTFAKYRTRTLSAQRIRTGKEMLWRHRKILKQVSDAYGVPARYIVALWGLETSYGSYTGGFDVVDALVTLAYDGRRGAYFRKELFNALKILDEGHIAVADMKGSWAGAMGQSQFMPSSFLNYAVDYNKDGRRDIWHTQIDVFASAANYLARNGWKRDENWGRAVVLPAGFDKSLVGLKKKKHIREWARLGVTRENGEALPGANIKGSLVQPDGPGTATYLIYDNYRTIMRWNNSTYFATSIGLLADRLIDK